MMNGCIYRTEFDVCKKYTTDKATSFCVGRNCLDRKPSNSDRIRSMTDEELAEMLNHVQGDGYLVGIGQRRISVYGNWIEWLQAESGEA